jgi:hypothetical protein
MFLGLKSLEKQGAACVLWRSIAFDCGHCPKDVRLIYWFDCSFDRSARREHDTKRARIFRRRASLALRSFFTRSFQMMRAAATHLGHANNS